jgi:hypothetical protein
MNPTDDGEATLVHPIPMRLEVTANPETSKSLLELAGGSIGSDQDASKDLSTRKSTSNEILKEGGETSSAVAPSSFGRLFIDTIFWRDKQLEGTENLMSSLRLEFEIRRQLRRHSLATWPVIENLYQLGSVNTYGY